MTAAASIARATVVPWIVQCSFEVGGPCADGTQEFGSYLEVIEAPLTAAPIVEDIVAPMGATRVIRAEVYPAMQFDSMPLDLRGQYARHYRLFMYWERARVRGKTVKQLEPWVDYGPDTIEGAVARWKVGNCVMWTGD